MGKTEAQCQREYRADKGGAGIAGKEKMIEALKSLKAYSELNRKTDAQPSLAALKISGRRGLWALLSTHPDLSLRIERLQK
jgi:heat shock protein HtpX